LGCKHPDFLFNEISSRQWLEWQIYNSLEPIDKFLHTGMLVASIYNTALNKKGGLWFEAEDFMPRYESNIKKQSVDVMMNVMMGMVKSGKAKIRSNK
jgi:ligand-binding sensor domain-containing protein